jgi:two-component system cell cycle response regulator
MSSNSHWSASELVPLADRFRYMVLVRAVLIASIAITWAFAPGLVGIRPPDTYVVIGTWATLSLVAAGAWRLWGRRALLLFGATLIIDGFALVWLSSVGSVTNVRYLIFLHMACVVLLASYRTGLKMLLWYSLLLFTVYFAGRQGAFAIPHPVPGTLARWDLGQLGVFAGAFWLMTISTAIFSSVNERELRRRRFDLEALARFGVALEGAATREAVANLLLDNLKEAFPFGRLLLLTEGGNPVVLGKRGEFVSTPDFSHLKPDSALLIAQRTRQTLLLSSFDTESDPWLVTKLGEARNIAVIPLFAEGGCTGVLIAEHTARNGSQVERRLLSIVERFVSHAALALRNAALLEQMERMASTDSLTQVANRRAFQATLENEIARSLRSRDPVSLIMIDIDNFKVLNDTYGHQVGDEVLRQVALTFRTFSRDIDTVARYGGEEFAVILPGCGPEDALASAERLRRSVLERVAAIPVTVSAGAATFAGRTGTANELIKAADDAMYKAKREGRNRVRYADDLVDLSIQKLVASSQIATLDPEDRR